MLSIRKNVKMFDIVFLRSAMKMDLLGFCEQAFDPAPLCTRSFKEIYQDPSVRPSSISKFYPFPWMSRKVRGTGSRNLAHAILREAHLGCERGTGKKRGWMNAFKIWERESGRVVHSPRRRRESGKGREEKRRNARAEDGSFEGAGRWSSS